MSISPSLKIAEDPQVLLRDGKTTESARTLFTHAQQVARLRKNGESGEKAALDLVSRSFDKDHPITGESHHLLRSLEFLNSEGKMTRPTRKIVQNSVVYDDLGRVTGFKTPTEHLPGLTKLAEDAIK